MLQTAHCPFTGPPPQSPNCCCQSSRTGPTRLCHLFHQCHKWEIMCLSPSAFQTLVPEAHSPATASACTCRHRQRPHQCHRQQSGPQLIHLDGPQLLLTGVRGVRNSLPSCVAFTFQLQALQTEVHRMAAASARIRPSCPCPVGAPTNGAPAHASLPAARPSPRNPRAPVAGASGRLPTATAPTPPSHSSPATFLDGLTCLRRGCISQVPQFCSTGYCDSPQSSVSPSLL